LAGENQRQKVAKKSNTQSKRKAKKRNPCVYYIAAGVKLVIDEVTIFIPLADALNWQNKCQIEKRADVNTFYGSAGNLKIKQTLSSVFISGSLAKYLNGENCTTLTCQQVREAVDKLETETGINLTQGVITRLAVGGSFIVKDNPANYLRLFRDMPVFKRAETSGMSGIEDVRYFTKSGAYQFDAYDKAKELDTLPELFKGCNVLRMEYRIVRRQGIKAKFKQDLTPHDLYNEVIYRELAAMFGNTYRAIPKTGRIVFADMHKQVTPAAWADLMAEQWRQNNPDQHEAILQDLKASGKLSSANLKRIRAAARRRNRDYSISDKNTLTEELDALVKMRVESGA
jgi:hypothetical protein